jgi:hypothetical protein
MVAWCVGRAQMWSRHDSHLKCLELVSVWLVMARITGKGLGMTPLGVTSDES